MKATVSGTILLQSRLAHFLPRKQNIRICLKKGCSKEGLTVLGMTAATTLHVHVHTENVVKNEQ